MSSTVYFEILGALLFLVVGALATLVIVVVRSARTGGFGEPPAGRESPVYLAAGPTGHGTGSGSESIEASGLAQPSTHHPKKKLLH
jgi:hypothetical protein